MDGGSEGGISEMLFFLWRLKGGSEWDFCSYQDSGDTKGTSHVMIKRYLHWEYIVVHQNQPFHPSKSKILKCLRHKQKAKCSSTNLGTYKSNEPSKSDLYS